MGNNCARVKKNENAKAHFQKKRKSKKKDILNDDDKNSQISNSNEAQPKENKNEIEEIKIKEIKEGIEKNIRKEYGQILDNLNSFEGKKNAIINYESSSLQKNLNEISEVIDYLNHLILSDSPDMIDFLIKYKQLNEKVEDIWKKKIKK